MKPWIEPGTPEAVARIEALQAAARRWVGTPFFGNSCTPGPRGGVSCHALAAAIYKEAGFISVEVPEAPMAWARYNERSLVAEFLDRLPEFRALEFPTTNQAMPGDLLGFRLVRTIHHLGICIAPGIFVHTIEHLGTVRSPLADPTWRRRLAAIWRPMTP